MKRAYYLRIKFKEKFDGRKIWYINDGYICDCVNTPFIDKEKCHGRIEELYKKREYPYCQGENIESITLHWTRR